MITLTKSGNAIVFTFDDNDHYLNDGIIEVPVNSLTLVTDESQMATFRKSASNDIFISATYDELGMSKSELESWFKENAFDTGGVTEEWVEEYVSESISGKADTSAVTASINAAVSGKMDTSSFNTYSAATDARLAEDEEVTSAALNELNDALDGKADLEDIPTNVSELVNDAGYATSGYVDSSVSGKMDTDSFDSFYNSDYLYYKQETNEAIEGLNSAVSGKVNTTDFNTYSASTDNRLSEDEEVTSAALNSLNDAIDDKADTSAVTASITAAVSGKQDTLVSGTNIKTINSESLLGSGNIDIQGGSSINVVQTTGTSTGDVMSQNAVTSSINKKLNSVDFTGTNWAGTGTTSLRKTINGSSYSYAFVASINQKPILSLDYQNVNKFSLVETSAITTSVTSSSTDSQVPSAKAVYDQLGGLKLVSLTQAQYEALTTKDSSTLYIITSSN